MVAVCEERYKIPNEVIGENRKTTTSVTGAADLNKAQTFTFKLCSLLFYSGLFS